MLISATSNNKRLVESGVFNQVITPGTENVLSFNFNGLMINLRTNLLHSYEIYNHALSAVVEGGYVILTQPYKMPDNDFTPAMKQGMLVPYEVGKMPDGKKIYISWLSQAQKADIGTLVLTTTYSFYEDL